MTIEEVRDIYNKAIASEDAMAWISDKYSGTWYTIRCLVRGTVTLNMLEDELIESIQLIGDNLS